MTKPTVKYWGIKLHLLAHFNNGIPITEQHFFTEQTNGKFLFDFHQYVLHRLKRTGITQIDSVLIDTFTNNKYNSYRRDPKNPARQYSSICLKD